MAKEHFKLLLVIVLVSCAGCMPYKFTKRLGVSGQVIDAETKSPISGASAVLISYMISQKEFELTTTTKSDGSFVVSPEEEWGLYIVPMDPAPLKSILTIKSTGYVDLTKDLHGKTMGSAMTDLGVIEMRPQK